MGHCLKESLVHREVFGKWAAGSWEIVGRCPMSPWPLVSLQEETVKIKAAGSPRCCLAVAQIGLGPGVTQRMQQRKQGKLCHLGRM